MSQFIDFTLPSTVPGRTLHGFRCVPEGQVRAVLQLSHGMVEYIDRYRPLAEYLADRGIQVTGHDHLGHGASIRTKEDYGYFAEPDGNRAVLADLHAVTVLTKQLYPNLPYFLLGHSMGSFYARQYLCEYGRELDGAIIMGTGYMSAASTAASLAVINAECLRNGESRPSAVATKASFGIYNRRFAPNRTSMDWLSLHPDNVDAYLKDPLCQGSASAGLFREMLSGIRFVCKEDNIRKMNHHTPILFISGAMDMVGDCSKGVERAAAAFQRAGMRDVTVKLYPELRHEVLKEDCREQVYDDIDRWLEGKLAGVR